MATYLVTGACGFIGSNFVHHLLAVEPTARIVALDNLGFASNEPNLDGVRDQIVLEVADIADLDQMRAIFAAHGPDFVVNFAAESHNDRAISAPGDFMRTNAPYPPTARAGVELEVPPQLAERGLLIDTTSLWRDRCTVGV